MEALEAGASTLLIDEDTSATNLMVRDDLMQQLVCDDPITPFIAKVLRNLLAFQFLFFIKNLQGFASMWACAGTGPGAWRGVDHCRDWKLWGIPDRRRLCC